MGRQNFLIEGPSGAGKTSVCDELLRRGHEAIHGDRVLAYQGDPETGLPLGAAVRASHEGDVGFFHGFHIWNVDKVRALAADKSCQMTFFCGGSRNHHRFLDLFDRVFVLEVDFPTLSRRLSTRGSDEFGGSARELAVVARVFATREDIPPNAISIDASAPLGQVVDQILSFCR